MAGLETIRGVFEKGSLWQSKIEVFIASFSAAEDLKSQWTAYADSGRGVCLGFDLRNVRPPVELDVAVTFAPCLYGDEEKSKLIFSALDHLFQTMRFAMLETESSGWINQRFYEWNLVNRAQGLKLKRKAFEKYMRQSILLRIKEAQTLTTFDLLRVGSNCKHSAYSEEREWRLALPHTKSTPLTHIEVLHRGPQNQIPYVAHNLFHHRLPLTRVITGPLCTSLDQVKALLAKHFYDVPTTKSSIPMRDPNQIGV